MATLYLHLKQKNPPNERRSHTAHATQPSWFSVVPYPGRGLPLAWPGDIPFLAKRKPLSWSGYTFLERTRDQNWGTGKGP